MDFQKLHDAKEIARDLGALGRLLLKKVPLPAPDAPAGRWDPESVARQAAFLDALKPKSMRLKVERVKEETPSTTTLYFSRLDGPLPYFRAGQYISVNLQLDGVRTSRPYSIASAPGAPELEVTVKAMPGEWVPNYLARKVTAGDLFTTSGPRGGFYYEPLTDGQNLVFLAGGSGITPFMSMLLALEQEGFSGSVSLLYGNRSASDVIFAGRLADLERRLPWLRVHHLFSEPGGKAKPRFMDAHTIKELVPGFQHSTFFVCGPRQLYQFALEALASLDVPPRRIRREVYGPARRPELEPGWPEAVSPQAEFSVQFEGGPTISAQAGVPLLNSLERHGVVVPAICRTGNCSVCRLRLVSGNLYVPPTVKIRESDAWKGYFHSCTAYPISDLVVRR